MTDSHRRSEPGFSNGIVCPPSFIGEIAVTNSIGSSVCDAQVATFIDGQAARLFQCKALARFTCDPTSDTTKD
jgi:hypothetical protein